MNPAAQAVLILLLSAFLSGHAPDSASGTVSLETDLDGDGRRESIVLNKESDPSLSVSHDGRVLWRGVPARWKPWKLMVADVDGDGQREMAVGVYKSTRFFPKPHNCLFIYSWDGRTAGKKWLGSSLSRPFLDFAFADLDGDREEELAAIEMKRDGRLCLAVYSWNGFGFTLDWQRGDWQRARLLHAAREGITVEADGQRLTLTGNDSRNN
ncbi:MAG TPA: FG-GAP-like repeat-containing protein [Pyrinomonadaceae bacterium]|nr:FG-GAP-like repeat-containing protein [Pyrinomonadaceae bacterium]